MCHGVEGGLGEVEEAGQADDEAVHFAEGLEAEDFGGVVAVWGVSGLAVKSVGQGERDVGKFAKGGGEGNGWCFFFGLMGVGWSDALLWSYTSLSLLFLLKRS